MQGVQDKMYVPLGDGDVPVADIVSTLEAAGYQGWYVLEQDTSLPDGSPANAAVPVQDVTRSLAHLATV
jgi:inosose dehydratase